MEIGVALAFFAVPVWAFDIHWEAFVAGAAPVAVNAYMVDRRGQCAREAIGVWWSD
jgi:hypothetical protein